ncbi:hypothetical protein LINPERPRIM_LOCUS32709, partial [Linum perenne]
MVGLRELSFHRVLANIDQYPFTVGQIMNQHNGAKIKSLKLSFSPTNSSANKALVNGLINKPTNKCVEELDLNFSHGPFRFLEVGSRHQAENMSFFNSGSRSQKSKLTDTERVMHKLKKPVEEDLFVYEASVVNCWCDLRATRSVRP